MAAPSANEIIENCTVFISYQWCSQPKVKKLFQALNSHDAVNPWMDIYKIRPGMNLFQSLASSIQSCDVLLACVSKGYVKSKNCEREIIYADCFNKPIIPLYIEKMPINELGSIGFLLARERYCSLYKDEKIFENLIESDEFSDILNGIEHVLKTKGKTFQKPLATRKTKLEPLDEKINEEVVQFRNDQPLEIVISAALEEKESESEDQENEASNATTMKNKEPIGTKVVNKQRIVKPIPKPTTTQPLKPILKKQMTVDKTNKLEKSKSEKMIERKLALNFEIHPLIKAMDYLRYPAIVLDPIGDRIYGENHSTALQRGGLPYYQPIGWQRFGLRVSLMGFENSDWLTKDGNPNEWAVGYHGLRSFRYLQNVLFTEGKFSPNFKAGMAQRYKGDRDMNKNSDNYDKPCGFGVYLSSKIEMAQKHSQLFVIDNNFKYKVILQCRINPKKIHIPESERNLYIVSRSEDVRPYGILVRRVVQ